MKADRICALMTCDSSGDGKQGQEMSRILRERSAIRSQYQAILRCNEGKAALCSCGLAITDAPEYSIAQTHMLEDAESSFLI